MRQSGQQLLTATEKVGKSW